MTDQIRQFILKRGNTAVSQNYTGPIGEITYDTDLKTVRVHDGVTPGGNIIVGGNVFSVLSSEIYVIQSNVANLQANVSALQGNAANQQTEINNLFANALAQQTQINTLIDNTNFGNLSINDQTISGLISDRDITLAPTGNALVTVPGLKIPVGSVIQGVSNIVAVITNLTLDSVVDTSTGPGDNLNIGDYGLTNGIPHPWTVYKFTTTPSPILQVNDVITGAGIPFNSNVQFVGSGLYSQDVIVNTSIYGNVYPPNGTTVFTTRAVVNAGLAITTQANTDITLNPGVSGNIVPASSLIPLVHNVYNLGTPTKRFKELWLGAGTIYVLDETLGIDLSIGARDGNLYVGGAAGLTVGKFTLTGNTIALENPTEDFRIGTNLATGNLIINRPVVINNPLYPSFEYPAFSVDRNGLVEINPPGNWDITRAALNIVGTSSGNQLPRNFGNTMLNIVGQDNSPTRISADAHGVTGSQNAYVSIAARATRGTVDAPSQTLAGDTMLRLTNQGWTSGGAFASSILRLNFEAAENFTPVATGTRMTVQTTPVGSNVIQTTATFYSNGLHLFGNTVTTAYYFADGSAQYTAANILAINASVAAVNANVVLANTTMKSYVDGQILAANAGVTAANLAMKGYVDGTAVTTINGGTGIGVSRVNGTVTVNATGVANVFGTANQVIVTDAGSKNLTLSLPQSIATNSSPTFSNLTVTNLTVTGNLAYTQTGTLTGKNIYLANNSTNSSQIDGGGFYLGNIQQAYYRSFLYNLNSNAWDTNGAGLITQNLIATDANFNGNVFSNGSAHFGALAMTINFPNAAIQVDENLNSYAQVVTMNHNNGSDASTDYVAVNDIGNDSSNYIDMGINSSTYTGAALGWTVSGPNAGYLVVYGNAQLPPNGNLTLGTATPSTHIDFHTSGTTAANIRLTINDNGLVIPGNVNVTGNILANNATVNNLTVTTLTATTVTGNINYANIYNAPVNLSQFNNDTSFANTTYVTNSVNTANLALKGYVDLANTIQSNQINTLTANAATQSDLIIATNANITQANLGMRGYVDQGNLGMIGFVNATTVFANVGMRGYVDQQILITTQTAANANVAMRGYVDFANTIQANAIAAANIGMQGYVDFANTVQANAIAAANIGMQGYVDFANSIQAGSISAGNVGMRGYVDQQILITTQTAANANVAMKGYVDNAVTTANVGMVGFVQASVFNANAGVIGYVNLSNSSMKSYVDLSNSSMKSYVDFTVNNIAQYSNVQVATYLPTYNGTIGSLTTANTNMKNYVDGQITAANAGVTAANVGMVGYVQYTVTQANLGLKGYIDLANTIQSNQINTLTSNAATQSDLIIAINANVTQANLGMKGYVDSQVTAANVAWAANASAQQTLIYDLQSSKIGNVLGTANEITATPSGTNVTLSLPGNVIMPGKLTLAAGNATVTPLVFQLGTLNTAVSGSWEYDGRVFYATPQDAERGVAKTAQMYMANLTQTMTSTTSPQPLFPQLTRGVSLNSQTRYAYRILGEIDTGSHISSTTVSYGLALSGGATIAKHCWVANPCTGSGPQPAYQVAYQVFGSYGGNTMTPSISNGAKFTFIIDGIIDMITSGNVNPQLTFSVSPGSATALQQGTFMEIWPVGNITGNVNIGNWA